jgi:hypothetical protein
MDNLFTNYTTTIEENLLETAHDMLELLIKALPYVEAAIDDFSHDKEEVQKLAKKIKLLIANVEGE